MSIRQPDPGPLTPAEAAAAGEATVQRFMSARFSDSPNGITLRPPQGRGRYINLQLHLPGIEVTVTLDTKDASWSFAPSPGARGTPPGQPNA